MRACTLGVAVQMPDHHGVRMILKALKDILDPTFKGANKVFPILKGLCKDGPLCALHENDCAGCFDVWIKERRRFRPPDKALHRGQAARLFTGR